jgi:pimeloyl-ACP methyl ester carboxylesterase
MLQAASITSMAGTTLSDETPSDTGLYAQSREAYAQHAAEDLKQAQTQARLLGELSLKHGSDISEKARTIWIEHAADWVGLSLGLAGPQAAADLAAYWKDAAQRWVLTLDTLCRRGDACAVREAEGFTPVLAFDYEIIVDGRLLERPANYALVRIIPPEGTRPPQNNRRPWVIIDPRAGQGSGIGGFKSESQVGQALSDGHPVYFVIFFRDPEPHQTLADVCAAEAEFLKAVRERHPKSSKPLVTGNCQGGWAAMILAATHPDLMGPVVIAGTPLSYWAGKVGQNPFRYLAGMEGGAVPALLTSDLGAGKFDGATLIHNFEQLNPGKTIWQKNYDIYSKVDWESERYLEFERWWSGFYFMNAAEIRWIVENLFVGNKLVRGEAVLDDGTPVDLTRIDAPVVVFASHGDNITPPQQALFWIADLYESVQELRARGHVIVYTLHDSIGHLGIFVSAKVANKQHKEIASVVKTIESLAPGLYEMLIEEDEETPTVSFEARTIDDILALGGDRREEPAFAAVARLSEWAVKSYELTVQPMMRALITPEIAEALRDANPMRMQYKFFSSSNPLFRNLNSLAETTREARERAAEDNPFLRLERLSATAIEESFNLARDMRDAWMEIAFLGLYATPWMMRLGATYHARPPEHNITKLPQVRDAIQHAEAGGYKEAIVRMLILLARARGSVRRDRLERTNRLLHSRAPFDTMTPDQRARLINEQNMIVEFAGDGAVSSLPVLLRDDVDRVRAVNLVFEIVGPIEEMEDRTIAMFKQLQSTLYTMPRGWKELHAGKGNGAAPDLLVGT